MFFGRQSKTRSIDSGQSAFQAYDLIYWRSSLKSVVDFTICWLGCVVAHGGGLSIPDWWIKPWEGN